jgi:hypothetical protein
VGGGGTGEKPLRRPEGKEWRGASEAFKAYTCMLVAESVNESHVINTIHMEVTHNGMRHGLPVVDKIRSTGVSIIPTA